MLSAEYVRECARELGFSACGICRAGKISDSCADRLREYVGEGRNADMLYLARNMELRTDARLLVPGTKSIVSVALNYYPRRKMSDGGLTLSYHAYGRDYHDVMKSRLRALLSRIAENSAARGTPLSGRAFCDTAPVAEKYWAWKAGIGFIGRNSLLVIPGKGSYFFLGELFLDDEADCYSEPLRPLCGNCRKCLEACPGRAITDNHGFDSRRCVSYLTVENRGALPCGAGKRMGGSIYGCDVCQKVCPHNNGASPTEVAEFAPAEKLLAMERDDWRRLTEREYIKLFGKSSVRRAGYHGLMRNIEAVDGAGDEGNGDKRTN